MTMIKGWENGTSEERRKGDEIIFSSEKKTKNWGVAL